MSAYTKHSCVYLVLWPFVAAVVVVKLRPPWSLSGERPCGFPFFFFYLFFVLFVFIRQILYRTLKKKRFRKRDIKEKNVEIYKYVCRKKCGWERECIEILIVKTKTKKKHIYWIDSYRLILETFM